MRGQNISTKFSEHTERLSDTQITNRLLHAAFEQGLPVALWRLPKEEGTHLIIDLSGTATAVHPDLEDLPLPGFLFTPYEADLSTPDARGKKQSLLLKAHVHYSTKSNEIKLAPVALDSQLSQKADDLLSSLKEKEDRQTKSRYYTNKRTQNYATTSHEQYQQLVRNAIEAIQADEIQKVVCAKSKVVDLPEDFQLLSFFTNLCQSYPNAFVSFVSIPQIGSWIGASPEILISINKNKIFRTISLAGTQPRANVVHPSEAVWRQKEIEEQAMVSRYIINCFKKIRLREYDECGPRTVVAGNLMHLRTDFVVDTEATNFPQLGSVMLELLHPTSAICGMPKAPATEFLKKFEQLDRSFFAGFLGPVNMEEGTNLFVNLRCMQLLEQRAVLYAGAGITSDSDPEKEWQETEYKCETLLQVLNKQ